MHILNRDRLEETECNWRRKPSERLNATGINPNFFKLRKKNKMALIIMILVLAFVGNMVALGASAILGSVLWTVFFVAATSANLYGLYTLRNEGNA